MRLAWNVLVVLLAFVFLLEAREPYAAGIEVDGIIKTVSAPNLVDLNRQLKTTSLQDLDPFYTPISPLAIGFNLRGLAAISSFGANSTTLTLTIPNAGITTSFTGSTRDESLALFKDYIKESRSVPRLLKAYAKYSPIDPIAGNPSSLMAQMGTSDYRLGQLSPLSGCECSFSAQPILHQFQAGSYVTRAFACGYDTTLVTLPLRYSYSKDGRWAIILDAPFTYDRSGGASSIFTSIGMGLRMPVTDNWSLTPIFRLGSGGSLDLCTSGNFVSTGLTSVFNYKICDYVVSLTNYAGYLASTNFWLTGINFNYRLQSAVFKNGFAVTTCEAFTFCNRPINFKISFIDTYFAKNRLYIQHYDEVEISLIANGVNPWLDYDCLIAGFAYQWGQNRAHAYSFNLAYQF